MRSVTIVLLCLVGPSAWADDPVNVWNRTYQKGDRGGSFPPCPEPLHAVTVTNGHFSIPWEVSIRDKPVTIAHIEGTVRPSGLAMATVAFVDPLPPQFVKAMQADNDSIDDLRKEPIKVKFQSFHDGREIAFYTEKWQCHATWKEDRESLQAAAEGGTVNCSSGPYAVALWSDKRAYGVGDYARVSVAGQPIRLYRCVDGCPAGQDPLVALEIHEVQPWAFVGACAGQKAPDAKLPAKGSAKWDSTYGLGIVYTQDWRCPIIEKSKQLVVKDGKFSLPWYLSTDLSDGQKYESMEIGHLDGVIADDGKVTLRYTWTVDKLPPEVLEATKYDKGHQTLEYINTLKGEMSFTSSSGKMNPNGQGLSAHLTFDGDMNCDYNYLAKGFKHQEFKESDGWKVDCYSYEEWTSKAKYNEGDQTVLNGGLYKCTDNCKRGSRPGRSKQWERVGKCK